MGTEKNSISRRQFSKTSAIGMTALAGFNVVKNANAQNDPLRIGVIGCGGRGTSAVENAIRASENVHLVAMHDISRRKLEGSFNRLKNNANIAANIKVDEDTMFDGIWGYRQVLNMDLDYVILATPPGYRPMHFEEVVEKGLHCFCEKPVATDPVGMRQFMAAAKKSEEKGLQVVAGTQRRHQQEYVETIEKIHNGAIGDVRFGRAYWCGGLPHARNRPDGMSDLEYQSSHNWYNYVWICGDNIVEQHIHNLDVMNWVIGDHPKSVIASGGRCWKPDEERFGNIWDNFSCDFEYPDGTHVMSMCRHLNDSYNEVSEKIVGSKGVSNCRDMGERGMNPYVQEHKDLQDAIRGNGRKWNEAMQVAESVFTAILGRMAAYTGQKLDWDEALNSNLSVFPEYLSFDTTIPVEPIAHPPNLY